MTTIKKLTAVNFDEVLASHSLILIDFWAQWCGPCKGFAKVLEEVAPKYPDCLFGSVDVETEKALAEEFSVRSVPFVLIIKDQVVVYAESGALSESGVCELLDQAKQLTRAQLTAEADE